MDVIGTYLTWEDLQKSNILRASIYYSTSQNRDGSTFQQRHHIVNIAPLGFVLYPPAGGDRTKKVKFLMTSLMADYHIGRGFYLTGEFVKRRALNMDTGLDNHAFYLQLRRTIHRVTPYISFAYSASNRKSRRLYNAMLKTSGVESLDILNRISADSMLMGNQMTLAIGAAYDIGSHHRVKLEFARTRLGRGSYLVDQRVEDGDLKGKGINVFTASYNFLF